MALSCPDCGAEVAAGARFCPACGVRQPERPAPSREVRKVVTVLFADVTGSTALGEQLDPEALRALMTRYFERMRGIIEAHGGTVEKFIGDAVMAVFGIPAVHEDDALRAVRAAAGIRDALAVMNEELEAERGIAIRFRTGVNTGEVVAGDPETGTTLVTGDTVNTAARLEQAALAGEILLGRLTYTLVRDAVDAEPTEPVLAKGKAEPLEAWRLVSVHAGAEGRARHLDAPMVGRERELAVLTGAWAGVVDARSPQLVTLVAPAGVGKSRLVREATGRVESAGGRVFRGRCLSYGEGITYWPVREIVHAAAGISESDDQAGARAKVEELLARAADGGRAAAQLEAAIGLSSRGVSQDEVSWAVRRLLEHLADDHPTLVVLEDLHWAEDPMLDLVDYLVDMTRGAGVLLVATARPEIAERRPSFTASREAGQVIRLEPLDGTAAGALVDGLVGGSAVGHELRHRILAAAEGNPLYVEEFVAMLRDDHHLVLEDGRWAVRQTADAVVIPPTIQALLAARLEGLPPPERGVAQRASVIGRSFEVDALADLDPAPDLGRRLLALVRKELLRPDRAELSVGDAYRFRHVLIRDAAYEALPKAERAMLHERVAGWLERVAGDRVAELQDILAFHLGEAIRYRAELGESVMGSDLARRAGLAYLAAAVAAYAREDAGTALAAASRAVELLPPGRPLGDALGLRFRAGGNLMDSEARIGSAERLRQLAEQIDDPVLAQRATLARLHIALDADPALDWQAAARTLDALAPEFERRGELEWFSDAVRLSGHIAGLGGNADAYLAAARTAVEAARRLGWPIVLARCQTHLIEALTDGSTPVDQVIEEIGRILGPTPGRTNRAYALGLLAVLEAYRDRAATADAHLAQWATLLRELGRDELPIERAHVDMALGRWADADATLAVVDAGLRPLDDAWLRAGMLAFRGQALIELGDGPAALEVITLAEQLSSPQDVLVTIRLAFVRAQVLALAGDAMAARSTCAAAVERAQGTQWPAIQGEALLSLARVHDVLGDIDEAEAAATEAAAVFGAKGHLAGKRRAEELRARIGRG